MINTDDLKPIIQKVQNGDPLTDTELARAIKFYTRLEQSLGMLGKEFHIARAPIIHTLHALEGFRDARAHHKVTFKRTDPLIAFIEEFETAHFRTVDDTGANFAAMLVWNGIRKHAGLPAISRADLPDWDGKSYVMPKHSKLLTNKV